MKKPVLLYPIGNLPMRLSPHLLDHNRNLHLQFLPLIRRWANVNHDGLGVSGSAQKIRFRSLTHGHILSLKSCFRGAVHFCTVAHSCAIIQPDSSTYMGQVMSTCSDPEDVLFALNMTVCLHRFALLWSAGPKYLDQDFSLKDHE